MRKLFVFLTAIIIVLFTQQMTLAADMLDKMDEAKSRQKDQVMVLNRQRTPLCFKVN